MLVDFIAEKRREYKQRLEERKWRHHPRYPNGTLITGRLTEAELAAAAQATSPLLSAAEQARGGPFIPPEIVREIIRHATDTYPAPFSIHYPIPSISQPLAPPPSPPPRFPYSSCAFKEDRDVDRKLHALSMKIKLSVSRVSRMWRDVAAEFLFNSIRIYHTWQISLLWHAFEGDARRRGEGGSIDTAALPGSAPWWVRELWIDFDKITLIVRGNSWEFGLADLLKICPNIVVYRGLGKWCQFPFSMLPKHKEALMQVLGLPGDGGHATNGEAYGMRGSELDVQDTGRRIEFCLAFEWEPTFPLYH
ncbi:hypothetical protein FRC00_005940 [Tulasnella sp. 408]|nr:hypothetical protein FRC00_005940 [Tulasnella sp. 408]